MAFEPDPLVEEAELAPTGGQTFDPATLPSNEALEHAQKRRTAANQQAATSKQALDRSYEGAGSMYQDIFGVSPDSVQNKTMVGDLDGYFRTNPDDERVKNWRMFKEENDRLATQHEANESAASEYSKEYADLYSRRYDHDFADAQAIENVQNRRKETLATEGVRDADVLQHEQLFRHSSASFGVFAAKGREAKFNQKRAQYFETEEKLLERGLIAGKEGYAGGFPVGVRKESRDILRTLHTDGRAAAVEKYGEGQVEFAESENAYHQSVLTLKKARVNYAKVLADPKASAEDLERAFDQTEIAQESLALRMESVRETGSLADFVQRQRDAFGLQEAITAIDAMEHDPMTFLGLGKNERSALVASAATGFGKFWQATDTFLWGMGAFDDETFMRKAQARQLAEYKRWKGSEAFARDSEQLYNAWSGTQGENLLQKFGKTGQYAAMVTADFIGSFLPTGVVAGTTLALGRSGVAAHASRMAALGKPLGALAKNYPKYSPIVTTGIMTAYQELGSFEELLGKVDHNGRKVSVLDSDGFLAALEDDDYVHKLKVATGGRALTIAVIDSLTAKVGSMAFKLAGGVPGAKFTTKNFLSGKAIPGFATLGADAAMGMAGEGAGQVVSWNMVGQPGSLSQWVDWKDIIDEGVAGLSVQAMQSGFGKLANVKGLIQAAAQEQQLTDADMQSRKDDSIMMAEAGTSTGQSRLVADVQQGETTSYGHTGTITNTNGHRHQYRAYNSVEDMRVDILSRFELTDNQRVSDFLGEFFNTLESGAPANFRDLKVVYTSDFGINSENITTENSQGFYDVGSNTLYLNTDMNSEAAKANFGVLEQDTIKTGVVAGQVTGGSVTKETRSLASLLVHEFSHIAEAYGMVDQKKIATEWDRMNAHVRDADGKDVGQYVAYLNYDTEAAAAVYGDPTGREWRRLRDQFYNSSETSAKLRDEMRSEWFAYQTSLFVRKNLNISSPGIKGQVDKVLNAVRSPVNAMVGDRKLSTEALDNMIADMLDPEQRGNRGLDIPDTAIAVHPGATREERTPVTQAQQEAKDKSAPNLVPSGNSPFAHRAPGQKPPKPNPKQRRRTRIVSGAAAKYQTANQDRLSDLKQLGRMSRNRKSILSKQASDRQVSDLVASGYTESPKAVEAIKDAKQNRNRVLAYLNDAHARGERGMGQFNKNFKDGRVKDLTADMARYALKGLDAESVKAQQQAYDQETAKLRQEERVRGGENLKESTNKSFKLGKYGTVRFSSVRVDKNGVPHFTFMPDDKNERPFTLTPDQINAIGKLPAPVMIRARSQMKFAPKPAPKFDPEKALVPHSGLVPWGSLQIRTEAINAFQDQPDAVYNLFLNSASDFRNLYLQSPQLFADMWKMFKGQDVPDRVKKNMKDGIIDKQFVELFWETRPLTALPQQAGFKFADDPNLLDVLERASNVEMKPFGAYGLTMLTLKDIRQFAGKKTITLEVVEAYVKRRSAAADAMARSRASKPKDIKGIEALEARIAELEARLAEAYTNEAATSKLDALTEALTKAVEARNVGTATQAANADTAAMFGAVADALTALSSQIGDLVRQQQNNRTQKTEVTQNKDRSLTTAAGNTFHVSQNLQTAILDMDWFNYDEYAAWAEERATAKGLPPSKDKVYTITDKSFRAYKKHVADKKSDEAPDEAPAEDPDFQEQEAEISSDYAEDNSDIINMSRNAWRLAETLDIDGNELKELKQWIDDNPAEAEPYLEDGKVRVIDLRPLISMSRRDKRTKERKATAHLLKEGDQVMLYDETGREESGPYIITSVGLGKAKNVGKKEGGAAIVDSVDALPAGENITIQRIGEQGKRIVSGDRLGLDIGEHEASTNNRKVLLGHSAKATAKQRKIDKQKQIAKIIPSDAGFRENLRELREDEVPDAEDMILLEGVHVGNFLGEEEGSSYAVYAGLYGRTEDGQTRVYFFKSQDGQPATKPIKRRDVPRDYVAETYDSFGKTKAEFEANHKPPITTPADFVDKEFHYVPSESGKGLRRAFPDDEGNLPENVVMTATPGHVLSLAWSVGGENPRFEGIKNIVLRRAIPERVVRDMLRDGGVMLPKDADYETAVRTLVEFSRTGELARVQDNVLHRDGRTLIFDSSYEKMLYLFVAGVESEKAMAFQYFQDYEKGVTKTSLIKEATSLRDRVSDMVGGAANLKRGKKDTLGALQAELAVAELEHSKLALGFALNRAHREAVASEYKQANESLRRRKEALVQLKKRGPNKAGKTRSITDWAQYVLTASDEEKKEWIAAMGGDPDAPLSEAELKKANADFKEAVETAERKIAEASTRLEVADARYKEVKAEVEADRKAADENKLAGVPVITIDPKTLEVTESQLAKAVHRSKVHEASKRVSKLREKLRKTAIASKPDTARIRFKAPHRDRSHDKVVWMITKVARMDDDDTGFVRKIFTKLNYHVSLNAHNEAMAKFAAKGPKRRVPAIPKDHSPIPAKAVPALAQLAEQFRYALKNDPGFETTSIAHMIELRNEIMSEHGVTEGQLKASDGANKKMYRERAEQTAALVRKLWVEFKQFWDDNNFLNDSLLKLSIDANSAKDKKELNDTAKALKKIREDIENFGTLPSEIMSQDGLRNFIEGYDKAKKSAAAENKKGRESSFTEQDFIAATKLLDGMEEAYRDYILKLHRNFDATLYQNAIKKAIGTSQRLHTQWATAEALEQMSVKVTRTFQLFDQLYTKFLEDIQMAADNDFKLDDLLTLDTLIADMSSGNDVHDVKADGAPIPKDALAEFEALALEFKSTSTVERMQALNEKFMALKEKHGVSDGQLVAPRGENSPEMQKQLENILNTVREALEAPRENRDNARNYYDEETRPRYTGDKAVSTIQNELETARNDFANAEVSAKSAKKQIATNKTKLTNWTKNAKKAKLPTEEKALEDAVSDVSEAYTEAKTKTDHARRHATSLKNNLNNAESKVRGLTADLQGPFAVIKKYEGKTDKDSKDKIARTKEVNKGKFAALENAKKAVEREKKIYDEAAKIAEDYEADRKKAGEARLEAQELLDEFKTLRDAIEAAESLASAAQETVEEAKESVGRLEKQLAKRQKELADGSKEVAKKVKNGETYLAALEAMEKLPLDALDFMSNRDLKFPDLSDIKKGTKYGTGFGRGKHHIERFIDSYEEMRTIVTQQQQAYWDTKDSIKSVVDTTPLVTKLAIVGRSEAEIKASPHKRVNVILQSKRIGDFVKSTPSHLTTDVRGTVLATYGGDWENYEFNSGSSLHTSLDATSFLSPGAEILARESFVGISGPRRDGIRKNEVDELERSMVFMDFTKPDWPEDLAIKANRLFGPKKAVDFMSIVEAAWSPEYESSDNMVAAFSIMDAIQGSPRRDTHIPVWKKNPDPSFVVVDKVVYDLPAGAPAYTPEGTGQATLQFDAVPTSEFGGGQWLQKAAGVGSPYRVDALKGLLTNKGGIARRRYSKAPQALKEGITRSLKALDKSVDGKVQLIFGKDAAGRVSKAMSAIQKAYPDVTKAEVYETIIDTIDGKTGASKAEIRKFLEEIGGKGNRLETSVFKGLQEIVNPSTGVISGSIEGIGRPESPTDGKQLKVLGSKRLVDIGGFANVPRNPAKLNMSRRVEVTKGRLADVKDVLFDDALSITEKWTEFKRTIGDPFRRVVQDRAINLRRLVEDVENGLLNGARMDDDFQVAELYDLHSGKVGGDMAHIRDTYEKPLQQLVLDKGLDMDTLDVWLQLRHGLERNAAIRKKTQGANQKGSGRTDAEIRNAITWFKKRYTNWKDYEAGGLILDRMNRWALKHRLDHQIISRKDYDNMVKSYKHYAPFRGYDDVSDYFDDPSKIQEAAHVPTGRGVSQLYNRGPRYATGMAKDGYVTNVTAWMFALARQSSIESRKNEVMLSFHKVATLINSKRGPDNKFFIPTKPRTQQVLFNNKVVEKVDINWRKQHNVVGVRVNGKAVAMTLSPDRDDGTSSFARLLENASAEQSHWTVQMMGQFMRYLSMVNTTLNPDFTVGNFVRDITASMGSIQGLEDEVKQTGVDKLAKKVFKEAFKPGNILGAIKGGVHQLSEKEWANSPDAKKWATTFAEFEANGGRTHFYKMDTVAETAQNFMKGATEEKGKVASAKKVAKTVFNFLDVTNGAIENGVRVSVYKAMVDAGVSKQRAALAARNLTVDFNKRGEMGSALSSFYMFANASIQGITRVPQLLVRSKKVQKFAGGLVATGFITSLVNRFFGGEDEDGEPRWEGVPRWEKHHNLHLLIPGGGIGDFNGAKVPLPYGFNVFYAIGLSAEEMLFGRNRSAGEVASELTAVAANAFNPLGAAEPPWMTAMPTLLRPFLEWQINSDFAGRKIYPEDKYGAGVPRHEQFFPSATKLSQAAAEGLNRITGGYDGKEGAWSVSPEMFDHVFGFLTGGAGRTVSRGVEQAASLASLQGVDLSRVPMIRRGVIGDLYYHDSDWFYDLEATTSVARKLLSRGDFNQLAIQAWRTNEQRRLAAASKFHDTHIKPALRQLELARKRFESTSMAEKVREEYMKQRRRIITKVNRDARALGIEP